MKKTLFQSLLFSTVVLAALVSSPVLADSSETNASEAQSPSPVKEQPSGQTTPDQEGETTTDEKDVVILHTNDVHGRIVEERGVIGDAKLATVIENERAKTDQTTLVVDAGDAFQGLPISNSTKGEARAQILNEIGYDAMAVGNHEFDFGLDEVKKYKEILNFPLLSSNTYVDGVRLFEASTIVDKNKEVKGDEFVVIGVTTPETATKTHPRNVEGITFSEPIAEVTKVIEEVNARALADGKSYQNYIILAHLGVDTTTPVEWRGSTLAEALSKNEALTNKRVVVIDGHSHTVASTTYGNNVTYNQTGSYLHNIGKVTFKSGQLLGTPSQITAEVAKKLPANPTIEKMVNAIKSKYDAENAVVVVANSPVELNGDRENVRVRETNLGNLVADALYDYGQTGFAHKTDLAVTNGGGLRETISKDKPITKGNVIAVLPFGNTISQIKVTGQEVKDMFEKSLGSILQVDKEGNKVLDENGQPLLEASGGFLQISGAKVYYDTNLEPGKRVLFIQIKDHERNHYSPLDLEKVYYLATNDFLAAGGDGYAMLGGPREEGPSMDVAFGEFLKQTDLTQYATITPNSRTISVDSKTFTLPSETKKQDKEETKPTFVADDTQQDKKQIEKIVLSTTKKQSKEPTKAVTTARDGHSEMPQTSNQQAEDLEHFTDRSPKAKDSQLPTEMTDNNTIKAEKSLPKTGSESTNALTIMGIILSSLSLSGLRKKQKN